MPPRWGVFTTATEEIRKMKKPIVTRVLATSALATSALAIALAAPAWAAEKYFVTVDTVGNCSIVQSVSAGKEAIGNADGYASMEGAKAYLDEIKDDKCKGVVVG